MRQIARCGAAPFIAICGIIALAACGSPTNDPESAAQDTPNTPSPAPVAAPDAQDRIAALQAEWLALATNARENLSNPRAVAIAFSLDALGPHTLNPLLDILADPNGDPYAKVMVTDSLQALVRRDMIPRLRPLTSSTFDATTRSCAIQLLGYLREPALELMFRELLAEPDNRVRMAALEGLVGLGDAGARNVLAAIYAQSQEPSNDRQRAVLILAQAPTGNDLTIMRDVLQQNVMPAHVQRAAVVALGKIGATEDAALLREVLARSSEESLKEWTRLALELLEGRSETAV